MTPIINLLSFLVSFFFVLYVGILIGREQMEDHYNEEVNPYKEVLLSCLNNGGFYFPDTMEAFSCTTLPLGNIQGPFKNE